MKKRAFITGLTGQDGSYLAELLLEKDYEVFGLVRRTSNDPLERLHEVKKDINILTGNLRDLSTISSAMDIARPDEVYNLAAQSHVQVSFGCSDETFEVNYYGAGRVINEAMRVNKDVRIYQASTSEMFGDSPPPQSESTPFKPVSPYAQAKLKVHEDYVEGYRDRHGLFICSGILFNHESPRRGKQFVTRKITHSLAKIKLGLQDSFELGNLDAKRDWGYAKDYVELMHLMLQQDVPEDYVMGTGILHSVRDFVNAAAKALDMTIHWEGVGVNEIGKDDSGRVIVSVNPKFYRPKETRDLLADTTKARENIGWKPSVSFEELVELMVKADFELLQKQS